MQWQPRRRGRPTPTNFWLSGGSVTGNHASECGGVHLSPSSYGAAFKRSGKADISGNTADSNSDPSNLYLNDSAITLNEPLPHGKACGVGDDRLNLQDQATRAETATILMPFTETIAQ